LTEQSETEARTREVQLLINVVEPDPEYQPFILTDEASLLDAVGHDEVEIQRRLDYYFGARLPISLGLPLWKFVDSVKGLRPGWPDEDG
jgi:hypothetical protein